MELERCQNRIETNTAQSLLSLKDDLHVMFHNVCEHQQANNESWHRLSKTMTRGSTILNERAILETLRYRGMNERRCNVVEAHAGTFEWIFDPHQTEFLKWLREGSDLYWINGSAGSGKSTLMKYLLTTTS